MSIEGRYERRGFGGVLGIEYSIKRASEEYPITQLVGK